MEPAIVLSTFTMGLGIIRALGVLGIPVIALHYDRRDMGYLSRYVSEHLECPHPERHEEQFIEFLLNYAAWFQSGVLFPASDAVLVAVARHKSLLESCYKVACPEWNIVELFIDKKHTYALAEVAGVPAPKTIVPCSIDEVEQYSRTVEYPCLVKPCQSHLFYAEFHTKMVEVESLDRMVSIYRRARNAGLDVMLQEIIPGEDANGVNYNSYFDEGEPIVEFTAEKVRNAPPRFGSPRVVISKVIPEVCEPGRRILKAMGFYGYSCTEFKRDKRDGVYKLMEVNGRHNLSSLLAVRCGINFPWLHYRHLVYGERPVASEYQEGVYWVDLIRDVGYSLKYCRQEHYSLRDYLRPYFEPHVFAVLDFKDARPFAKRCVDLLGFRGNL